MKSNFTHDGQERRRPVHLLVTVSKGWNAVRDEQRAVKALSNPKDT